MTKLLTYLLLFNELTN